MNYVSQNYDYGKKRDDELHKIFCKYARDAFSIHYLNNNYKIKPSVGIGNRSEIPWVAIFDKRISTKASEGVYIVYLFTSDYSKVYLSLNQGWEYFNRKYGKDANKYVYRVSEFWRDKMHLIEQNGFNRNNIFLNGKGKLSKGYEVGNICSKCYTISDLSTDNNEMINDLISMISTFKELKAMLIDEESYETTVESILNNSWEDRYENSKANRYLKGEKSPVLRYVPTNITSKKSGFEGSKQLIKKINQEELDRNKKKMVCVERN